MKPGIREDDILLEVWEACSRLDRPQDVFRTMLRRGLMAMVESGDMPEAVIDTCNLDSLVERRRRKGLRARAEPEVPVYAPQPQPQQFPAAVPYHQPVPVHQAAPWPHPHEPPARQAPHIEPQPPMPPYPREEPQREQERPLSKPPEERPAAAGVAGTSGDPPTVRDGGGERPTGKKPKIGSLM